MTATNGDEAFERAPAPTPARLPRPLRKPKLDMKAVNAQYPMWGPATLALLVAGVGTGYLALVILGKNVMHRCLENVAAGQCNPRLEGLLLALPVLATALGLVISLMGGRVLAKRGGSPMRAAAVGWGVFGVALLACLALSRVVF
jgi:hypothetical protein